MSERIKNLKNIKNTGSKSGCLVICLVMVICLGVFYLYNLYLEYTFRAALEKEGAVIYALCKAGGKCPEVPEGWARSGLGMEYAGTSKLVGTTRKQTVYYLISKEQDRFRLCRWTAMKDMDKCYGGGVNETPTWEK